MSNGTELHGALEPVGWRCSTSHDNPDANRFCRECGKARPTPWRCSRGHDNADTNRFCSECAKARPNGGWFSEWKKEPAAITVEGFLRLGIVFLIGVVIAIFVYSIYYVIDRHDHDFPALSQVVISNVLLIFIVLELIEIAREQIRSYQDNKRKGLFSPRLGKTLLRMLLIVGVLSSVRHLLTVGAQLTTSTEPPRSIKLWELGVTAGAVLLLVGGLILVSSFYKDPPPQEVDPGPEGKNQKNENGGESAAVQETSDLTIRLSLPGSARTAH